jgi:hypothetical protein
VGAAVVEPADVKCGGDVVSCNNDGGCCCCCCDGAVLDGRLPFSELCAAKNTKLHHVNLLQIYIKHKFRTSTVWPFV